MITKAAMVRPMRFRITITTSMVWILTIASMRTLSHEKADVRNGRKKPFDQGNRPRRCENFS
jgi:hypothetical protein